LAIPVELRTDRLLLRRWRDSDRELFARMSADPEVMRFYVAPYSRAESDAFVDRAERQFDEQGYGLWAVEVPSRAPFIGYVGLWASPFFPAPEIGWRLDKPYWHRGYATEAARAALRDGFERIGLAEIVSFTTPLNVPSIRVMERLGMNHDAVDDFDHPNVPIGHPYRRHVVYRLRRPS
jgi:RimJ/RimL family protein N-acetyltransferase